MTKTETAIRTELENRPEWKKDRFGHYTNTSLARNGDCVYRFKMQKTSVRFEVKDLNVKDLGWIKLASSYYKDVFMTSSGKIKIGRLAI